MNDISLDVIRTLCERAFGADGTVVAARELRGGTVNRTWLVVLTDREVILRLAPPPDSAQLWDERRLMRREHNISPHFAAISHLLPRTLLADFTHQLIDRDYVIQTRLPGERWDTVSEQLTLEENMMLWEQFGEVTRLIHATKGSGFGSPHPGRSFPSWSQTIQYRLEAAAQVMTNAELGTSEMALVLDTARAHSALLDEIREPRLLHGDLWLFNLLIAHDAFGARLTGVLDIERAWWGDPMADWTMFVLSKITDVFMHPFINRFWQAYGAADESPGARFRSTVYEAMHVGAALAWAKAHNDTETLERGAHDLHEAAVRLPTLC